MNASFSKRVEISAFRNGMLTTRADVLAIEEPLEIQLSFQAAGQQETRSLSVSMRTPGEDFDLAVGFLFTEGIIRSSSEIVAIERDPGLTPEQQQGNVVRVVLAPESLVDLSQLTRNFYTTSSCGVCGKSSLEALHAVGARRIPHSGLTISSTILRRLPELQREAQPLFDSTGGLHASALFDANGTLLSIREDVGRHNALDKVIGAQLREGRLPLIDGIILVSGRASFELVQKCVMAGAPLLAAVGAPSSLAVELARELNLTLVGFLGADRFNIYSGEWRISA